MNIKTFGEGVFFVITGLGLMFAMIYSCSYLRWIINFGKRPVKTDYVIVTKKEEKTSSCEIRYENSKNRDYGYAKVQKAFFDNISIGSKIKIAYKKARFDWYLWPINIYDENNNSVIITENFWKIK